MGDMTSILVVLVHRTCSCHIMYDMTTLLYEHPAIRACYFIISEIIIITVIWIIISVIIVCSGGGGGGQAVINILKSTSSDTFICILYI